jgi:peptidoglycan L-alanyl-D-glutamate endopeptidase CwlK
MSSPHPLDGLDPDVAGKAAALLFKAAERLIQLRITQGYRSYAEQAALYAKGRTAPGPIVTYAPPGYSWHNWRRAFDVCILTFAGDKTPKDVYDGPWEEIGEIGEKLGLEWGGHFTHPDRPHFQDTGGRTLDWLRRMHLEGLG